MTTTALDVPSVPAVRIPLVDVPSSRDRALGVLQSLGPAPLTLPLTGVLLRARVAGRVAEVTVEQHYSNRLSEPIEAVYTFPLGGGAAVRSFELQIGSRVVRGAVQERAAARRDYAEALDSGKRAALLEQERDDVFTLQVGNVLPGEEVTVRLGYSERLPFFEDGLTELRLPMVVAPRYVGGAPLHRDPVGDGISEDTDTVPDASRLSPPRLAPGFDPKVALSLEVELFGALADLACSQHATRLAAGPDSVKVALARTDEHLDRDFVLRWKLGAAGRITSTLLVHDGTAMVSLVPPAREGFLGTPRDVVFLLDRSGSMQGPKMASAARACSLLLQTLAPRDRYSIVAFDDTPEWMPGDDGPFVIADEGGLTRGERYLRSVEARGGTELTVAMAAALDAVGKRAEGAGRVPILVLLTDGQVGDESSVLRRLQTTLGEARVFTVGIDTAVNDGFLRKLAALAGGTSTFVEPGAQLESALQAVGREIGTPLVTDLRLEGIDASTLAPARMPDLFEGRATAVFFRTSEGGQRPVRVTGKRAGGEPFSIELQPEQAPLTSLTHLWARARVSDLEDRFRAQPSEQLKQEIVALAVRHTLLTRFTAFIAVDDAGGAVNLEGSRRKLVQPVEQPAQWAPATMAMPFSGPGRGMVPASAMAPSAMAAGGGQHAAAPQGGPVGRALKTMARSLMSGGQVPPAPPRDEPGTLYQAAFPPEEDEAKLDESLAYPPLSEERVLRVRDDGGASARQRDDILAALEALVTAVAAARVALDAGRLPAPESIERPRAALFKALSGSAFAADLPLLQKFLRAGAVELVGALRAAAGTAGGPSPKAAALIAPLFQRHAAGLVLARDSARTFFGLHRRPLPGTFWEATI